MQYKSKNTIEAVQVLETTFDGLNYSSPPFSDTPDWLLSALKYNVIVRDIEDITVLWRVPHGIEAAADPQVRTTLARPGFYIVYRPTDAGRFDVYREEDFDKQFHPQEKTKISADDEYRTTSRLPQYGSKVAELPKPSLYPAPIAKMKYSDLAVCVGCASPDICRAQVECHYTGSPMLNPDGTVRDDYLK